MPSTTSEPPLAYLLTFHTYGSWLHGSPKGSVDRVHSTPGAPFAPADPVRRGVMKARMKGEPLLLDSARRICSRNAIQGVCHHRQWELHALSLRTNHVHVVLSTPGSPERAMGDLKSWATRRMREAGLVGSAEKVWSRHGSTRYLWDERSIEAACRYVIEGQGVELD